MERGGGRFEYTATTFPDPEHEDTDGLLVCGGVDINGTPTDSCFIRRNGSWKPDGANKALLHMPVSRYGHTRNAYFDWRCSGGQQNDDGTVDLFDLRPQAKPH